MSCFGMIPKENDISYKIDENMDILTFLRFFQRDTTKDNRESSGFIPKLAMLI